MADCFVHDIEEGVQGTDIKAAFLKCAADEQGLGENVEKVHRACARASKRTGASIMAHSHPPDKNGLRQIEIFEEEGVDPAKVQLAHVGDTDDVDAIEKLLERGVFIGMDRYGLGAIFPPDEDGRNKVVLELLERGHGDRMTLSQDFCSTIDWFPEDTPLLELVAKWSMTLVFEEIIPALLEGGATEDQVAAMLDENPRRWLTA
jgi:phosphotriesterase-related protein